jgi:hypothetical protein
MLRVMEIIVVQISFNFYIIQGDGTLVIMNVYLNIITIRDDHAETTYKVHV